MRRQNDEGAAGVVPLSPVAPPRTTLSTLDVFPLDGKIDRLRIIRQPGGATGEANFKPLKVLDT